MVINFICFSSPSTAPIFLSLPPSGQISNVFIHSLLFCFFSVLTYFIYISFFQHRFIFIHHLQDTYQCWPTRYTSYLYIFLFLFQKSLFFLYLQGKNLLFTLNKVTLLTGGTRGRRSCSLIHAFTFATSHCSVIQYNQSYIHSFASIFIGFRNAMM